MELFFPADYKLNGKLNQLINFQKTPREVAAMRMNVRLLIGDFPTNVNLSRTRRITYNHCDYCENFYSVYNTDSNLHAIITCPLISDNDNLSCLLENLFCRVCELSGITAAHQLSVNSTNLLHLIANPTSFINSYLNLPVLQIQSLILQTQSFILSCHNER